MSLFGKDVLIYAPPATVETEYVTKEVNIHEHRQSTSDDARLLHDLEKEALNKITDAIHYQLKPTNIEAGVIEMQSNFMDFGTDIYVVFDVNGQKITSRIHDTSEWHNKNQSERFEYIYELVAKEIARDLFIHNPSFQRNIVGK